MHLFHYVLGVIAGVVAFCAFVPYIISILKGKTKPNRATAIIWSIVNVMAISSYIASGARTTIFVGLVYAVMQFIVLFLAIKFGMGGFGRLDIICLVGALFGVIAWIASKDSELALYVFIFIEVLGFLPTFKKSFLQPKTEDSLAWLLSFVAASLNLLAVSSIEPKIIIYPTEVFISNLIVIWGLMIYNRDSRTQKQNHPNTIS